ncbi:MAG: hypothetical protein SFY80_05970 [Verrucomicrobiota bacterium]|nr:hypothetical protein [Verrucomicrobiota bacterium]
MSLRAVQTDFPAGIRASGCITNYGDATASHAALCRGEVGLKLAPVLGVQGGDLVPMGLLGPMTESLPPRWLGALDSLAAQIPDGPWGGARTPVFITSSNYGVGNMLEFAKSRDPQHLPWATAHAVLERFRERYGWGANCHLLSHACVSAHLGLVQASRWLERGMADRALVFSFDFLSAFVTGGFSALKILNGGYPAPYRDQPVGSIGLGDGAAFAVLDSAPAEFRILAQHCGNEMYHFTANEPGGSGFTRLAEPFQQLLSGRRIWIKGHGTGTLEAGRIESSILKRMFPSAPLTSWKGGLGHTLGSCGLVELVIAMESVRQGRAPGTVGSAPPFFVDTVQETAFPINQCEGAVLCSNAFGGAHAALFLSHA